MIDAVLSDRGGLHNENILAKRAVCAGSRLVRAAAATRYQVSISSVVDLVAPHSVVQFLFYPLPIFTLKDLAGRIDITSPGKIEIKGSSCLLHEHHLNYSKLVTQLVINPFATLKPPSGSGREIHIKFWGLMEMIFCRELRA